VFGIYRGISREAKYLIYQSILPAIAYGMFFTDISYFLTTVQGLSYTFMGVVVTVMGVSAFASCIPLGILADRHGRKKMLIIGNVLASVIIASFVLTTNPVLLIVAAVFEGISEAAFAASSGALLAEKAEGSQRSSAFSLFSFAQGIAYGVGSLAIPGIVVFEFLGYSSKTSHALLYVTVAVFCLISTLLLLKVKEAPKPAKTTINESESKVVSKESQKILAKYVLASAVIAFGAGMVVPLMTAWFNLQYGIPDTVSGPILGITSVVIGVSSLASPYLARKIGLVKAIVVLQASSTIFMFATPLSGSFIIASAVYTVRAFLMNMASPLSWSLIMGSVAKNQRGAASGISAALWRLPNALSTFVGAFLMAAGFLALPFFIASLLYFLSSLLFWRFFRNTKMSEEKDL
jgi:MFS family permease